MNGMRPFLPYGRQLIEDDDVEAVVNVLRGDYLTTGPAVVAFENALAAQMEAPFAVSCSSATAGLHLAAMAIGLGPGDSAVVPANTFLATANAIRYVGADVVFADVDENTGLSTGAHFEAAVRRAASPVKAFLPVHFAGQAQGPGEIRAAAERCGALVIEDACHAIGAEYDRDGVSAKVGSCLDSDMAVFSFHPVKTIAMGEGGAVTTRNAALAEKLMRFRSHGMVREASQFSQQEMAREPSGGVNPWYYEMPEPGFNYRASDIHCALGLSQLSKLVRFVEHRNMLAEHYDRLIAPIAPVVRPIGRASGCTPAWHLYVVLIDFEAIRETRAQVMKALQAQGVGTQVHYIPVPHQPYYRALYGEGRYPGADAYYSRCLSLPMSAAMSLEDATRVVDSIVRVLGSGCSLEPEGQSPC